MKTLRTTILALLMIVCLTAATTTEAQTRRPGQSATTTSTSAVRPGKSSSSNKRPGANRHDKDKGNSHNTSRPGKNPVVRPGQSSRPSYVTRPSRPNRLPSYSWSRPSRPSSWQQSEIRFRNTILGITFGTTIGNSLDRLYASNYSIDGYDADAIYLRNVTEMNYRWTDATLFYSGSGYLTRCQFYESSIGYDTSRFYGVMNQIRHLYGSPMSVDNSGRTHMATWLGYDGEYITLEYRLLRASSGYRYFTILTMGR